MPKLVFSVCKRDLEKDNCPFIGPRFRKESGILWKRNSPQGMWDHIAEKMLLEFAESTCPIFPCYDSVVQRVNLRSKGHGKLSIHFAATQGKQLKLFFRIIVFCKSPQSLRSSRKRYVKNTNPFTIDQGNLIW